MTLTEIKKALNSKVQEVFPSTDYKYYGLEIVEGYERPCFFTSLEPVEVKPSNVNTKINSYLFIIKYFQSKKSELDMLQKADALERAFGLCVKVGKRAIHVNGFDYDFVGQEQNILQITVNLQWHGLIEKEKLDAETMEHFGIEYKKRS